MSAEPDLGVLLAAACERIVRELLASLAGTEHAHLTPSQALAALFIDDGLDTVTQLAERLGMTTQAISKICATLSAEGLLAREPHEVDARSRRLSLTPSGSGAVARMRAAGVAAERQWAGLVGAETLEVVKGALAAFAFAPGSVAPSGVRIRFS